MPKQRAFIAETEGMARANTTGPDRSKRWRLRHPEKVKAANKKAWDDHKKLHPEIGTRENPRNDTRFKIGMKMEGAGVLFQNGHTINSGRPSANKGKPLSSDAIKKIRAARAKQVITADTRLAMSRAHIARREKNHFWKGGITTANKRERNCVENKLWRESVLV